MTICNKCHQPIGFFTKNDIAQCYHVYGRCDDQPPPPVKHYSGFGYSKEAQCYLISCPICNQSVFFIRHNGGSVWMEPPLGSPWNIHPCMDSGEAVRNIETKLNLPSPKDQEGYKYYIGVVQSADTRYSLRNYEYGVLSVLSGGDIPKIVKIKGRAANFLNGK